MRKITQQILPWFSGGFTLFHKYQWRTLVRLLSLGQTEHRRNWNYLHEGKAHSLKMQQPNCCPAGFFPQANLWLVPRVGVSSVTSGRKQRTVAITKRLMQRFLKCLFITQETIYWSGIITDYRTENTFKFSVHEHNITVQYTKWSNTIALILSAYLASLFRFYVSVIKDLVNFLKKKILHCVS